MKVFLYTSRSLYIIFIVEKYYSNSVTIEKNLRVSTEQQSGKSWD